MRVFLYACTELQFDRCHHLIARNGQLQHNRRVATRTYMYTLFETFHSRDAFIPGLALSEAILHHYILRRPRPRPGQAEAIGSNGALSAIKTSVALHQLTVRPDGVGAGKLDSSHCRQRTYPFIEKVSLLQTCCIYGRTFSAREDH